MLGKKLSSGSESGNVQSMVFKFVVISRERHLLG